MSSPESSLPRRIVLKLSGEMLKNEKSGYTLDANTLSDLADEIREVYDLGIEIGIVVGGGNIFRGLAGSSFGIGRVQGDHMGMLATCINALALQDALESKRLDTRVMTAIEMRAVAEPYIRRVAMRHMEKGRVVIFGGGTGNPYFTTDSAAALRASEIGANLLLKATKVDGIYSADPEKEPNAVKYDRITYKEAIDRELRVMDTTAFSLCRENGIPIAVFNLNHQGEILRVVKGESVGTRVNS